MTEQPEEKRAARIEHDLLDSCDLIREHWATIIEPTTRPTTGAPSTDTLTATERRILLRQRVDQALTRWVRVIIHDRPLTHAVLPDGGDRRVTALLNLLERHARWFATDHADSARAARQLAYLAREVKDTAEPPARDHVTLGPCPFVLPDPEGREDDGGRTLLWACQGRIMTRIGGDGDAYCTGCGQEALIGWWEDVLRLTLPFVTLPNLAPVLHRRLGMRVSERTLRNWRRDGILVPALRPEDHQPAPRPPLTVGIGPVLAWDLFDPREATAAVTNMARDCALCGKPWDGGGDICRACWVATVQATPTIAEEPTGLRIAGIPVVTIARRPARQPDVPDPHDTDRPARCHYSDLPIGQCACGRHATRAG